MTHRPRAESVGFDANSRDDDEPVGRQAKRACIQVAILVALLLPIATASWVIRAVLGLPPDTPLLERLFWGGYGVMVWYLVNHWAPALARKVLP